MLTEFQKKKLTHYFNILDYDKNHTIERKDFIAIGENLAILWGFKEGTESYARCLERCENQWIEFRKFTRATTEHATLDEWLSFGDHILVNGSDSLYDKYMNKMTGEIFDSFDTDGDGFISLDEFVDFFMAYRIEIRYSAKSFMLLDTNGDEQISRDELLHAIKRYFRSNDENDPGNWLFGFWEQSQ